MVPRLIRPTFTMASAALAKKLISILFFDVELASSARLIASSEPRESSGVPFTDSEAVNLCGVNASLECLYPWMDDPIHFREIGVEPVGEPGDQLAQQRLIVEGRLVCAPCGSQACTIFCAS